jgi:hypothetical protein
MEQVESLRQQARKGERVRVEVLGIEARAIYNRKGGRPPSGDTLVVHGFDHKGVETIFICPASHFSASLTIVPNQESRRVMGFAMRPSGTEVFRP